ncbi:MAG: alpha/beta hydrolase [Acidimicrobiales bacterium]|nr:alpha/beta hydrolase [Acidimicrobiales bacterium]
MVWRRVCTAFLGVALLTASACSSDEAKSAPTTKAAPAVSTTTARLVDGDSGFATSHGLRIHYEVHGKGAPLVLVHGWGASIWTNWDVTGWLDALKPLRTVIAIDIRGHGDSDKPHDGKLYGYAPMSDDVIAVMDHLGVAKADFVGYSLGAFVGAHLLGHEPDRFTSFALIGIGDEDKASLALAPRIAAALRAPAVKDVTDSEAAMYRTLVDADPRTDREALALAALEMWPQGYPIKVGGPGLADTKVPVLILNGADDPYAKTDDAFAAAIPGSRLVEIPGADHLGIFTHPQFRKTVIDFLSRNGH